MSDLQTREQMLAGIVKPDDILDLLGKVDHVQYKTGWQSKHLAADAIREIARLRTALSEAEQRAPEGWKLVPTDDETREVSDSSLPFEMIEAGIRVQEQVNDDHCNYVAGVTTDWDCGMVAVAMFRAMCAAAPAFIPSEPHDAEGRE